MNSRIFIKICGILSFLCLSCASLAHAVMPLPSGSQVFSYPSSEFPLVNAAPSQAKPVGVGDITSAHDLTLRIGLDSFPSPVDIYVAIYAPALLPDLLLIQPNGNLATPSSGLFPWRAGTSGPVSEGLFGTIPLSVLPSGDYGFYLLVAPAGTPAASLTANCYLWATSVGNLRVQDVSEKAASLFGGDVEGAAAILMALGNDYTIENVTRSVMAGTLTEYGEILAATSAKQTLASQLPVFCKPGQSPKECHDASVDALRLLGEELTARGPFRDARVQFERVVTAYVVYLAGLGYSGTQINEAIMGDLYGDLIDAETYINLTALPPDFPFGGIFKNCPTAPICEFVKPEFDPPAGSLFSDLDPKDFAIPSTEGLTFPAYYKGTGTAWLIYSNPNVGEIECTKEGLVVVAKVEIWKNDNGESVGYFKIHSGSHPGTTTSSGKLECEERDWAYEIAGDNFKNDNYKADGTYHKVFGTNSSYGVADVKFNDWLLWGSVGTRETLEVLNGRQITTRGWQFELDNATEAEYETVIPQYHFPAN